MTVLLTNFILLTPCWYVRLQSKLLLTGEKRIETIQKGAAMAQYSAPAAPADKSTTTLNLHNLCHASADNRGGVWAI
jgi:hypothetical protein